MNEQLMDAWKRKLPKGRTTGYRNDEVEFRIMTASGESIVCPNSIITKDGRVLDLDSYAVFKKSNGIFHQMSPWYMYYGTALNRMNKQIKAMGFMS